RRARGNSVALYCEPIRQESAGRVIDHEVHVRPIARRFRHVARMDEFGIEDPERQSLVSIDYVDTQLCGPHPHGVADLLVVEPPRLDVAPDVELATRVVRTGAGAR